jgi:steroid 5-alpha reductase family enzyme
MTDAILVAVAAPSAIMLAVWAFHELTHKSGWIDVAWTFAVGISAVPQRARDGADSRQYLYAVMVAAWSLRLGTHLTRRTLGHPDDPRYAKLREDWAPRAGPMMLGFLMLQAGAAAILTVSVTLVARAPAEGITAVDVAAALLFAVAWIGEATADAQMRRFRANPANRGGICDVGLWAWSRHPNYFFEWLSWAAIALGLLAAPGWLPGWTAIAAPLMMLHLLLNVSGVPPLEEHMRATRGAAFDAYAARTSVFFPRPPKSRVEVA